MLYLEAGEEAPDWALFQRLTGRLLADKNQRLLDLDQQLEQVRTGDRKLRAERDQLAAALRGELRMARFLLDESFGKELGAGLFRWRKLAKPSPRSLVLVAKEIAGSLRSPQLASTGPRGPGGLPPAETVEAALEAASGQLESHLERLEPSQKRETYAVGRKQQEWLENRAKRLAAQDLLVGIYRVAGLNHLAARLRPKRRAKPEPAPAREGGDP